MALGDHPNNMYPAFLVRLHVNLIGGGTVTCLDAIEAPTPEEAKNQAVNYFILSGHEEKPQAVSYGGTAFYPGTIATVRAEVVAALDRAAFEVNKRWLTSLEDTREWERRLQEEADGKTS